MHRIAFVVSPGFQTIGLTSISVFEMANLVFRRIVYEVRVLSATGGPVCSSMGFAVATDLIADQVYDTVIFAGGCETVETPREIVDFAQRATRISRRVTGICNGACVLAEAGVLGWQNVVVDPSALRDLRSRYPLTKIPQTVFSAQRLGWTTTGGGVSGDIALAMIESDLGRDAARLVAKEFAANGPQVDVRTIERDVTESYTTSERIRSAIDFAKENLHQPLQVADLAIVANLSFRQFSRVFRAETGCSPAKTLEQLRLDAARRMMEQTSHSIEEIAKKTGFSDRERMRRAFLRVFGLPPQAIRRLSKAG
ncbi:GlxA family transcriptional regulator [Paraburkholderia caribensis]|uniref:GlxA family transcriptional regulator n=1 Tax=Paraburkholderia caribensis TaxID=75105 RepID=UPI001CAB1717|nr:helix-turn-helix domain-containing protein [Paraburkholderia caribensis]CAG9249537.1 AraC family transcriptional regulator [Paraburkholderia caribensis]